MDKHINSIANRLSLRIPQRDSLEILARLTEIIPLEKHCDLAKDLEVIASEYPPIEDFERDFPSLCFVLATGVGKTRLMGAFISYLHLSKGLKHFFVLAPNLTIYNKLIADFTPGSGKYIFQGISEFAMCPPEIITGDNYESGRGIRGVDLLGHAEDVHINIFNISKINSEVRGGKSPRIKRLCEYIGESYFDYLSGLDDLVLLMDESHRYRASAGVKAINELKPILGLELTATPQIESGKKAIPFQNVIYSYPLYKAMEDGYVKEPAVATRENFNAKNYTEDQLEQLKLEDGIRLHETVKTELKIYADNFDKPRVKPFMLVVAQDTTHAENIMELIKSDKFFEGRYKDRMITVHSAQGNEEKDETVERLLSVEDPNEPTEIVIHVNMLKEGWDVTNLYTIVPLRAANSRTLVEQSIGRGLRLPYGKRTGVRAVDRLTIVAHERFDEIISEANEQKSIIRTGIVIGKDIDFKPKKLLKIKSNIESIINRQSGHLETENFLEPPVIQPTVQKSIKKAPLFQEEEKRVAFTVLEVIKEFEQLPTSRNLQEENIQQAMVKRIEEKRLAKQADLEGIIEKPNIGEVVRKVIQIYVENTIDMPRIVQTPKESQNYTFEKFTLDISGIGRFNPVDQQILIQHLRTTEKEQLHSDNIILKETRLEDHIVSTLIDFNDISYNDHADIIYDLAGQMVAYLRSYLSDEEQIHNALQFHRKDMANVIYAQMQQHYKGGYVEYDFTVKGFLQQKMNASALIDSGEKTRYFRNEIKSKQLIKGMVFGGFSKCLQERQKFDSDTERLFSILLEDDSNVLKWVKTSANMFRIYLPGSRMYVPDFVVETNDCKLLCEPKMGKEVETKEVQEKARAAQKWCEVATEHELQHGSKPWQYILIPHSAIQPSATLSGLVSRFGLKQRS